MNGRFTGRRALAVGWVVAALVGAGCGGDGGDAPLGAPTDVDAAVDAPVAVDGSPDVAVDASVDSPVAVDGSPDVEVDASVDGPGDGAAEVASEAGEDASAEADASGDGPVEDGSADAAGDAPADDASDATADADAAVVEAGIGVLGATCSTPGELACAGHAMKLTLVCDGTRHWAINATCARGEVCDSLPGLEQGTCAAVVAECAARQPNEVVCAGQVRAQCGPDLASTQALETCSHQTCSGGACVGVCAPTDVQCSGTVPQTCDGTGAWADGAACPYLCSAGACAGVCVPGAKQCSGTVPQTCDVSGAWADGVACPYVCSAGACAGVCVPGAKQCSGTTPQTCDVSGAWVDGAACNRATEVCWAGACVPPPSCDGGGTGRADCGPSGSESCCFSPLVTGGTVQLDRADSATVSDYRLDKYEITVGRFRRFVDAVVAGWRPSAGSGKHTHLNGGSGLSNGSGGYEPGWDVAWNTNLPTAKATWDGSAGLACSAGYQTWTTAAGANEKRPINCVDWYQTEAFCIWDGGFLPSEAEWQYAAAGGSEGRQYPWSVPASSTTIDCSYANYYTTTFCNASHTTNVGFESPKGDGKWGQSDLAGNVVEWTLDWASITYTSAASTNYANVAASLYRTIRGGSFGHDASFLLASFRGADTPASRSDVQGARCARTP